jgi:hypothetical protein
VSREREESAFSEVLCSYTSLSLSPSHSLLPTPLHSLSPSLPPQYILETMAILPNAITVPIMSNYGLPHPAKGALNVVLLRAVGTKGADLYCRMHVREGRSRESSVVRNNKGRAEFNEGFHFIVRGA